MFCCDDSCDSCCCKYYCEHYCCCCCEAKPPDVKLTEDERAALTQLAEATIRGSNRVRLAIPFLAKLHTTSSSSSDQQQKLNLERICASVRGDDVLYKVHQSRGLSVPEEIVDAPMGFRSSVEDLVAWMLQQQDVARVARQAETRLLFFGDTPMPDRLKVVEKGLEEVTRKVVADVIDRVIEKEVATNCGATSYGKVAEMN